MSADVSRDTARTSAVLPGGIVPSHGHGHIKPWAPGQSGRPPGLRNDVWLACQRLCRQRSPEAADEIYRLMQKSDDERIRFMAADWVYTRAWGKPEPYDPKAADNSGQWRIDVSKLTSDQRALLLAIIQSGAVKPAEDG